ncbi:MAG: TlpA disulfide reductase family protein [Bacteroidales bacterium]
MKPVFSIVIVLFFSVTIFAQDSDLPSVTIRDLDGRPVNFSEIDNEGKPIILSFWATWCTPCHREMNAIAEVYEEWQQETGVKYVAVSVDDSRSSSRVLPMINSNYWDYDFYLDPNHELKRAMNVNMIPHTFLLNGDNEVVWQHTSYSEGIEDEIIQLLRKLNAGEDISEE